MYREREREREHSSKAFAVIFNDELILDQLKVIILQSEDFQQSTFTSPHISFTFTGQFLNTS